MSRLSKLSQLLTPLVAVAAAFLVGGLVVTAIGESPFSVYAILFRGAFGSVDAMGYVLFNAVPLIFTGLAVAFAFRAGLFNIGGEGQLYIGAFVCALGGLDVRRASGRAAHPAARPGVGGWRGRCGRRCPGYLKARFGVHEVINTIMMNFIAVGLTSYFVINVLKEPGQMTPQTAEIAAGRPPAPAGRARSRRIGIPLPQTPTRSTSPSCWPSRPCGSPGTSSTGPTLGYEIRAVGMNATAAEYAGINVRRTVVLAMVMSGAFAGLVATNEVMGFRHRFLDNFSSGLGFMGIAVALLGKNTPIGVLLAALLFGVLNTGALEIDVFTDVPRELILVLQAVTIILVVVGNEVFARRAAAREGRAASEVPLPPEAAEETP